MHQHCSIYLLIVGLGNTQEHALSTSFAWGKRNYPLVPWREALQREILAANRVKHWASRG